MKSFGKALVICMAFVIAVAICFGCSKATTSNDGDGNNATHPKEYYEGYWVCCGYEKDGTVVSFDKLSTEEKATFPYLNFELEEGQLAAVSQINNDGSIDFPLMGKWETTSKGIRIDNADFILDRKYLLSQQRDRVLFFEHVISGSELQVNTIEFDGIMFDAPSDLAYVHDGVSQDSDNYGIVNSTRAYGPSLIMSATPTDAQDIMDLAEDSSDWEDYCTNFNGTNYVIYADDELHGSLVQFVANGKLYRIDFSYSEKDPVDYQDYPELFYTTIELDGSSSNSTPRDTTPSGAIPWQEASQHVGETVSVYGPVVETDYATSSNGQPTFIDIGAAYPDKSRVTVVIWGEDRSAFPEPPETMYQGKTLCVTGEIYIYNDACNIKVSSPSQIQVI